MRGQVEGHALGRRTGAPRALPFGGPWSMQCAAGEVAPRSMRAAGFEPTTFGSGGRRSIQLSYARVFVVVRTAPGYDPSSYCEPRYPPIADDEAPGVGGAYAGGFRQSGRLDLNQRPPAPEAGALPGYATPRRYELGQHNAPGETRTPNLLIRSQMLYPIELRALRQVRQLAGASWRQTERTRVAFAHSGMILPLSRMPVKAAPGTRCRERGVLIAVGIARWRCIACRTVHIPAPAALRSRSGPLISRRGRDVGLIDRVVGLRRAVQRQIECESRTDALLARHVDVTAQQ